MVSSMEIRAFVQFFCAALIQADLFIVADFIYTFLGKPTVQRRSFHKIRSTPASHRRLYNDCKYIPGGSPCQPFDRAKPKPPKAAPQCPPEVRRLSQTYGCHQRRYFHDYFVTHLPSSSLHPDSRSSSGPHHKLPRAASTPHTVGSGRSPAAAPPMTGPSRELTVVRIPLRSAKHHFGVSVSRGTRPYNEDTYQAGTIEIPAFAKRAPLSLNRSSAAAAKEVTGAATSAGGASGDPQVFYFGVFDGHGGHECSDFLKDELHEYIENASEQFELVSSLQKPPTKKGSDGTVPNKERKGSSAGELSSEGKDCLSAIPIKTVDEVKDSARIPERNDEGSLEKLGVASAIQGQDPVPQKANRPKVIDLEMSLVKQWKETVGGYFRRFKPEYFSIPSTTSRADPTESHKDEGKGCDPPISIETVLMYAFLRADLDFITAQASKPDPESSSDMPLNYDEILGEPSRRFHKDKIGGPTRFKGGSTASVAIISTPTPTPFWHPASPSTLVVAHVGDTRILLCETSTGLAVPVTTNHHPSSPIEGSRLRRYAATFVTDSFGEERMSGLANTRAFGDMRSKRIGVSAEPELRRYELGPAQYSFLVLVSDGVSGTLSDQEIVDVVKEAKTPEQGASDVVGFATEVSREGDNATCLVIRLGGWERRGEGGMGSLGTKEARDYRRQEATDPRTRRT
jgi:protein phosphatase PTC6